ncbi:MAG: AbiH family protein [Anaerobutyricum hallii]
MNILVIGNGFDLAHRLPTTYKDFLEFASVFREYDSVKGKFLLKFSDSYRGGIEEILKEFGKNLDNERKEELVKELRDLVRYNKWLNYFWKINRYGNWIDFEMEMSRIIQSLDKVRKDRNNKIKNDIKPYNIRTALSYDEKVLNKASLYIRTENLERIKQNVINDLNELTRCLEIYLCNYVGEKEIKLRLPDIEEKSFDCVLSFNYTDTFEKIYDSEDSKIKYDYIHGKVNVNSDIEKCNLILGIDEYLEDSEEQQKDNEYIQFKKFYQRIYKKTGCKYTDWIEEAGLFISENNISSPEHNNVYILGHSMDVTDGDILSALIKMKNTKTTVFYHNKEALGRLICNLVKIIGEKEVIKRTSGKNASIVFREQQEAVLID